MERKNEIGIEELFIQRWSPRAFSDEEIDPGDVAKMFEAARWAPSCFNEQPWRFVAATGDALPGAREILMEGNRTWADQAPLLVFVFAKKQFSLNGNENRWAGFDTGAAWMSLALQAQTLGLITHAMGGFSGSAALEYAGLSGDEYDAIAAIAIGKPGAKDSLPEALQEREAPSDRKPLDEILEIRGAK